jgi:hypothetical protein
VDIDASGYSVGAILMRGKPIFYHPKMFCGDILNYPTYDNELYVLVQYVNKWKNYLMVKETIIHNDH